MKKILGFFVFAIFLTIISCTKEEIPEDDPLENTCNLENITYTNTIKSLISGCTSSNCHGADSGRSMANYNDAKNWAGKGRILGALRHENGFSPMPKNGSKLDECKIGQISKWISSGFPE